MNQEEYISSGAIETCVMGFGSSDDLQELERMAALYPEVKALKEQLEAEQESMHLSKAIAPPPHLKQQIFKSLDFAPPIVEETPVIQMGENGNTTDSPGKPQVVPIMPTPKPMRWLQRAVAASAILLMGSILLNFYFYSRSVSDRKQVQSLLLAQNSLEANRNSLLKELNIIAASGIVPVKLNAMPDKPGSEATVFWNHHNKEVYLVINNLPSPKPDQQYQLWAIVDGKPVDAGMLETESAAGFNLFHKMKPMENAEAFAITLEKKGGNPTPLGAMYAIGKI